jgi:hypothetical protein
MTAARLIQDRISPVRRGRPVYLELPSVKTDMTAGELKNALSPNDDNPNIWPMVLEKLHAIVAARGGRPVTENGSLILERLPQAMVGATVSRCSTNSMQNFPKA